MLSYLVKWTGIPSGTTKQKITSFIDNQLNDVVLLDANINELMLENIPPNVSLRITHETFNGFFFSPKKEMIIQTMSNLLPASNLSVEIINLPDIPPSDELMRCIFGSAHFFLDPIKFPEYNVPKADTCLMMLGVKYMYTNPKESTLYGADLDVWEGLANSPKLNARDRYYQLIDQHKAKYPNCIVGKYSGSVSAKSRDIMTNIGVYPCDGILVDRFQQDWILPWNVPWQTSGQIDILNQDASDLNVEIMINVGLGKEGGNRKFDIQHFDEVGYVQGYWPTNVDRFQRVKKALNDEGVLLSINVGGWGWSNPYNLIGPNVVQDIISMTNSIEIEGPWSRWETSVSPYGFRTKNHTEQIIANMRTVMDAGLCIEVVPVMDSLRCNRIPIINCLESNGNLFIALNRAHFTFPLGNHGVDRILLKNLPLSVKYLENYAFTPITAPNSSQIWLRYNWGGLDKIKQDNNITGTISFTGGEYWDMQAPTRVAAGLVMMARNPGHKIVISDIPYPGIQVGNGDPNNIDCWWWWPKLMGPPLEDYKIETLTNDGFAGVVKMSRKFQNGVVEVYPVDGYTLIKMN